VTTIRVRTRIKSSANCADFDTSTGGWLISYPTLIDTAPHSRERLWQKKRPPDQINNISPRFRSIPLRVPWGTVVLESHSTRNQRHRLVILRFRNNGSSAEQPDVNVVVSKTLRLRSLWYLLKVVFFQRWELRTSSRRKTFKRPHCSSQNEKKQTKWKLFLTEKAAYENATDCVAYGIDGEMDFSTVKRSRQVWCSENSIPPDLQSHNEK